MYSKYSALACISSLTINPIISPRTTIGTRTHTIRKPLYNHILVEYTYKNIVLIVQKPKINAYWFVIHCNFIILELNTTQCNIEISNTNILDNNQLCGWWTIPNQNLQFWFYSNYYYWVYTLSVSVLFRKIVIQNFDVSNKNILDS